MQKSLQLLNEHLFHDCIWSITTMDRIVARIYFNTEALRLCRGTWHWKFVENSTNLWPFIFKFGGLAFSLGGISPPSPPVATGLYQGLSFNYLKHKIACISGWWQHLISVQLGEPMYVRDRKINGQWGNIKIRDKNLGHLSFLRPNTRFMGGHAFTNVRDCEAVFECGLEKATNDFWTWTETQKIVVSLSPWSPDSWRCVLLACSVEVAKEKVTQ